MKPLSDSRTNPLLFSMSNLLAGLPVVEDCFGADEDEYVSPRVAVLYQLKELPYLDGYRTPMKLDGLHYDFPLIVCQGS